jgi:hypothetical protein
MIVLIAFLYQHKKFYQGLQKMFVFSKIKIIKISCFLKVIIICNQMYFCNHY